MRRIGVWLLALGMVAAVGLVGLAVEDLLIIGTTDRVVELSFSNSYDHFSWHVLRNTTDALTKFDPDTGEFVGAIAESWDVSADGLVWTFYIRPGITFWDGEVCDAAAVKYSLDRTIRLDGPEGGVGLIKPYIDHITVIDPLTLEIVLTQADAVFDQRVSEQIAPALIYSPTSVPDDDFANGQYAGTGPYKLIEYIPDQHVIYEAYDGYYGEAPMTPRVVEQMYSDAATLRAAIEAGDIDVVFRTLSPQDFADLEDNENVIIQAFPPSPGIRYILFNVTQPPVDVAQVRQAICYAVDRSVIVDQVFSGTVTPIYTMVPAVDPPFFGALPTFPERDLNQARALLAEVGYTAENPLQLNLWYTPNHYGTTEADVAAVLKGSLEEMDEIEITIQVLEWTAYSERMSEGGFDMFLLGWHPDYFEPSNFLAPWTTESPDALGTYFQEHPNFGAYQRILDVATTTVNKDVRASLYEAVQILSTQDVPWIPLWSMTDEMVAAWLPGVHGVFVDITMDISVPRIYKE
ncbi:peptide ABC transporter substrate-binding protein [Candidatus Bipolaricaulota bacterium]|nr:peptide ABC transporter substrate-binding protein [Candidatus Bipolaricaulota bacterium]